MASIKEQAFAGLVTFSLLAAAASSCNEPIQPPVGTVRTLDASSRVRAIQAEEERRGREVSQIARSQVGRELEAAERLARSPQLDAARLPDGGPFSPAPDSQVAGKLERATADQIVIRDDSGFEYRLRAGESTQVTANGKPARLTDFKQGTDVRAEFFWKGSERIATAVDVIAGSPER